jgi:hypothetical protein
MLLILWNLLGTCARGALGIRARGTLGIRLRETSLNSSAETP